MTTVDAHIGRRTAGAERDTDTLLIEDWLGLAGYLAEAVASGHVALDTARAELAAGANGVIELRALHRAADAAATRLGPESLVTTLLRSANMPSTTTAEVA